MIGRPDSAERARRLTKPRSTGHGAAWPVRSCVPAALAAVLLAAPVPAGPAAPKATETSYYYDLVEHSVLRPVARALDPALGVRKLTGNPRQALNVDANDQVRLPSTWWQPRAGFRPVSVEQMLHGPGPGTGPAAGKILVTSAKTQGVTPGFFIKDARGDRFLLKFDPYDFPEMATGADVICTYLYWAAGYNVPDNTIFHFSEADVDFEPGATYSDVLGTKRPITREFMEQVLKRVRRGPDGSIRCLASRLLIGKPLGPFEYSGRRKDDLEDRIPHQHRRELRGLWTIAAWTNHADVRGPNSLDMWVEGGGRSFVRHHLIDFGSTLGSGAIAKRSFQTGTEYFIDYGVSARSFAALGLRPFDWEDAVDPNLPSIGYIEAANFKPRIWRPDYPNPAFDERTERDIRWGARIVAGMSDALIRAAVERAEYSDPRATESLIRVLIGRRDRIVAEWPVGREGEGNP